MLSVEYAEQSLVTTFAESAAALLRWSRTHPEAGPQELLERARAISDEAERALFAAAVEQAGVYETAPLCPVCGSAMHRLDTRRRTVVTRRGERGAAYRRWRCRGCGVSDCPRYQAWGVRHGLAPEVQEVALRTGCGLPYREAEAVLGLLGMPVSDNTVRRLCVAEGGQLAQSQAAAAEAVAGLRQTPRADHAPARLYLLCDGLKVRVAQEWREVRLGLCYETAARGSDDQGRPPAASQASLRGWLADCDTFCERFYAQACEAGLEQAAEVICLADGAAWIWERLPAMVPLGTRRVELLDFYHAAENVAKAVRAVWGEGTPAAQQQFGQLRRWLRAGDPAAVMDRLRSWQGTATGEALAVVTNVLAYLRTHRDRMGYLERSLAGYHIGSGHIESSCKRVGLRLKRPGANWSEPGLTAMLALQGKYWSVATAAATPLELVA